MERNESEIDRGSSNAGPGNTGDANEFSGSPPQSPEAGQSTGGDRNFDFEGSAEAQKTQALRDRAKNAIDTAGERLSGFGSTVRERTGTAKNRLADVLETGAERLRERAHAADGQLAGATAGAADAQAIQGDGRVTQASDRLAGGLDATASWLREADLDTLKTGIEQQVRDHPGRTLLIAAGLGYLIGRAFRNQ
jgi:ElaB/YqjD/DUF883 family membrane-anchored ribosome-binding protein